MFLNHTCDPIRRREPHLGPPLKGEELKPNGRHISVTEENKAEYVMLGGPSTLNRFILGLSLKQES